MEAESRTYTCAAGYQCSDAASGGQESQGANPEKCRHYGMTAGFHHFNGAKAAISSL